MSHYITYKDFPCKTSEKAILKNLNSWAYDPQETSCYHGNMTFHKNPVYKTREEAEAAIKEFDKGWYDDHSVRYRIGHKINWLCKIEYHC